MPATPLRVAGFGLPVSGCRFRVADFGLPVSGRGFRVADFGLRIADSHVLRCDSCRKCLQCVGRTRFAGASGCSVRRPTGMMGAVRCRIKTVESVCRGWLWVRHIGRPTPGALPLRFTGLSSGVMRTGRCWRLRRPFDPGATGRGGGNSGRRSCIPTLRK